MATDQLKLTDEFVEDYRRFCAEFDRLAVDFFAGPQLAPLTEPFKAKHGAYLASLPYQVSGTKFPHQSELDTFVEDARICAEEPMDRQVAEWAQMVAQSYLRLSQAHYLLITYNKSRHNEDGDRRQVVDYGRRAMRFDPANRQVNHWFMIGYAWHLDLISSPKERTLAARAFCQSIQRCLRHDPDDAIAHHLYGRYQYGVAQLTWLERTVAHNLLGVKLEGSYKEAERQFLRAHELKGPWLPTGLFMARVLQAQKRPFEEVRKWADMGVTAAVTEPTSELEMKELEELRRKLKLSN